MAELTKLSNGITIGDAVYYVSWLPIKDVAIIWVSPTDCNDPLEELFISDLLGENGETLEFSSELQAHAFLEGLKNENE